MINKIDPLILNKIKAFNIQNNIDCIVYYNECDNCKSLIDRYVDDYVELPFINAYGVTLPFNQILDISKYNQIKYITSSVDVQAQINVSKKIIELNSRDIVHNFCTVIIDTGVSPVVDLCVPKNRIVKFIDLVNNKNQPYDDNGHGTFVSSILCGNGTISGGKYAGIDTNSNIIVIKALDNNGEATVVNILKAMQWVMDNRFDYNIKVVCMSFGSSIIVSNDPLIKGAEIMWDNGICVVAAAGNSGPESGTIKSPGASYKIITVGAIDDFREGDSYDVSNFRVADFSSRGPVLENYKPDVVAPGVEIKSACNYRLNKVHYKTMSGTSVATPMVAGICNLLIASNSNYKPNDIKRLLMNNTISINNERNAEGFGLINCKNLIF